MSESIWDDPMITAYVLGELSEVQREQFEQRLEANADLAAAVEEVRGLTGQLEELYAAEPTKTLESVRRDAIVASQSAALNVERPTRSWKLPLYVVATAAALLLLVGVAPWLRQQQLEVTVSQIDDMSRQPHSGESVERVSDAELNAPANASTVSSLATVPSPSVSESREDITALTQKLYTPVSPQPYQNWSSAPGQQPPPSPPATSYSAVPATPQRAIAPVTEYKNDRQFAEQDGEVADASESLGDVQVQMVPELGNVVILRGAQRDATKVKAMIDQVRKEAKNNPRLWPTSPSAAPIPAGADAHTVEVAQSGARPKAILSKQTNAPKPAAAPSSESLARRKKGAEVTHRFVIPSQPTSRLSRSQRGGLPMDGLDLYFVPNDEGRGPGVAGDRFEPITENDFRRVSEHPFSTVSIDVDTAAYSKARDYLSRARKLPRQDSVRIEELLNYFDYEYDPPAANAKHPFAANATVTGCPWNENHRLARIALKGKTISREERPPCNLVFLIDTSGSMNAPNKLPLVVEGMKMLVDQLEKRDRVAITVYAGAAGKVLDSVSAKKAKKIRKALSELSSGGSTNGGAGIALAYQTARDNFIPEGVNRVILCTDGDFNVGVTGTDQLVRMVEQEANGNIFLSVLGFGMGNHNDAMLEQISGRGNGNYAFIDTPAEAHKVLVKQTSGTLVTIAKDVKLQIEFNPTHVHSYRLIGYENRVLAKEDFNDDKKDAGEIGAGHAVTALYEIVPAGVEAEDAAPKVDPLKYQTGPRKTEAADSDEMMTLKLRYKQPDGDTSTLVDFPVADEGGSFKDADHDVRFAAAVASFGMQLRRSKYAGDWKMNDVLTVAEDSKGEDEYGLRAEFVELVRTAAELMGQ